MYSFYSNSIFFTFYVSTAIFLFCGIDMIISFPFYFIFHYNTQKKDQTNQNNSQVYSFY